MRHERASRSTNEDRRDHRFGQGADVGRQILIIAISSLVLTQIAVFATSIYLHRALAHRSLSLRPIVELVFRIALWLVTGGNRLPWGAGDRKHHTYNGREADSP